TVASDNEGAVVVTEILEESEAYRRGLRLGDEIVSFAGRSVGSTNQYKNVLGIYPKGWVLPLTYRRDGEKQEIYVRLRGLHRKSELSGRPAGPRQRRPGPNPRPDRKPGGNPPDGEPHEEPPQPPDGAHGSRPKTPPHLEKFFAEKSGF